MSLTEKYNKLILGIFSGFLLPLILGFTVFLFTSGHNNLHAYLRRIVEANIVTQSITLCVFPNVFIFLFFNRFDMLNASRGVLGITIFWAIVVFGVKFLG